MAKRWNRTETWVLVIVVAVGLVPAAVLGLWAYMSLTATPLHPSAKDVPAASNAIPSDTWAAAADQGRQIVRSTLAEKNLPGLSVAVGVAGSIVWAEGFGWADLEKRVPVTPQTRFRIGSASVALTSAAVGLLLEKDRLKLDDEIQAYVPEFPAKQWPVTLRQVMGHVAGIPTDDGDEGPLFTRHCARAVEGLPPFVNKALKFEPGTQYRFSNYGWILMSAVVEAVAEKPLAAFMHEQIFEPLHMDETRADSEMTAVSPNRATVYFPKFAGDPHYGPDLMRDLDYSCYSGASAFVSTPSDLVRFGIAINGGKLLRPETVQRFQPSLRLPTGKETGYGLGWDLETVNLAGRPTTAVGHDGDSLAGMVSSLMTFPEDGIVVAVTSNISYADTSAVALKVAQAFTPSRNTR